MSDLTPAQRYNLLAIERDDIRPVHVETDCKPLPQNGQPRNNSAMFALLLEGITAVPIVLAVSCGDCGAQGPTAQGETLEEAERRAIRAWDERTV